MRSSESFSAIGVEEFCEKFEISIASFSIATRRTVEGNVISEMRILVELLTSAVNRAISLSMSHFIYNSDNVVRKGDGPRNLEQRGE